MPQATARTIEPAAHGAPHAPERAEPAAQRGPGLLGPNDRDAELLAALQAGRPEAFEELVRRETARLLATARRILHSEAESQDAVQDAFRAAFEGIARFEHRAKLSTWLHRIAVNAALMRLRSERRRPEGPIDDLLPTFDDRGAWASGMAAAPTSPEDDLDERRTLAAVRACIDELPERYRTVLLLRDIEELDTGEAATLLGITPNAVKVRLHRARQALRTLIERAR